MECPQCKAKNPDGKNFCSECGSLLAPQLKPLIRAQVEEYVQKRFKDQKVVDVETTEAIAERFERWGKWFLVPATILLTILGLFLGLIGIRDYSDVHKAAQQAITEANKATQEAQEAQSKSEDAIKTITAATKSMSEQLTSAQQLSTRVSDLESKTANQITSAQKQVEYRMSELDRKLEAADKTIAEQQAKLTSTNELVTAMFSKGKVETFPTTLGNTPTFVVYTAPGQKNGAMIFILLKSAPIYQTVQIGFHVYIQPRGSYFPRGNILTFLWGEAAETLKQWPLEVSYVPDPTYHGAIYSALSVKDGHVFADGVQFQ